MIVAGGGGGAGGWKEGGLGSGASAGGGGGKKRVHVIIARAVVTYDVRHRLVFNQTGAVYLRASVVGLFESIYSFWCPNIKLLVTNFRRRRRLLRWGWGVGESR